MCLADPVCCESELDELICIDSKRLASLYTEIQKLEDRILELGDQGDSAPGPSHGHNHSQDNRIIESQSRYIQDRENLLTDMRQEGRTMERKIRGLEDQLDSTRAVYQERLRARDARISQLEEELANINQIVRDVRADLNDGVIGDAVDAVRSNIMMLVEKHDEEIRNLEGVVGLNNGGLDNYLALSMEASIIEMRRTCAREVQFLKMAVNKLEALVKAAARIVGAAE